MKFPIYLHKDADDSASGFAPGVAGVFFAGATLTECLEDAASALDAHIELLVEEGQAIPQERNIDEFLDDEDCQGGIWAIVAVDITRFEGKPERVNITLPKLLLESIDSFVKERPEFSSRSAFLAEAARHEMKRFA